MVQTDRLIYVALSGHGFGHIAQTAPVVNALRRRLPRLRVALHTEAPPAILAAHFRGPFVHIRGKVDVGMTMANALDVMPHESHRAYLSFHRDWESRVATTARRLERLKPDLVLSNVSYLLCAAAARAGIPACALCSLNWGAIYRSYCEELPGAEQILKQILAAYGCVSAFIVPTPAMDMGDIACRRFAVGPIARLGANRRLELEQRLGAGSQDRLVLVSLGGIPIDLPFSRWRRARTLHWIIAGAIGDKPPGFHDFGELGMDFIDALRSCDALVTKPGYGNFVEAACNGTPVLYTRRLDWPEEPWLVRWLQGHATCIEFKRAALGDGALAPLLERLWQLPRTPPPEPSGVEQAASVLEAFLAGREDRGGG